MKVVEHADQRKAVDKVTPVLIFHQLAEYFTGSLHLRGRQMPLATNHQHNIFDGGIVQLLFCGRIQGRGQINAGNDGADMFLDLGNLHGLPFFLLHDSAHVALPLTVANGVCVGRLIIRRVSAVRTRMKSAAHANDAAHQSTRPCGDKAIIEVVSS